MLEEQGAAALSRQANVRGLRESHVLNQIPLLSFTAIEEPIGMYGSRTCSRHHDLHHTGVLQSNRVCSNLLGVSLPCQ